MFIALTVCIALFSIGVTVTLLLRPIVKQEAPPSPYQELITHGVVISEGLLQARHSSVENIEQLYEALKAWEVCVKTATETMPDSSPKHTQGY